MYKNKKVLAIIPARGGSKGLPGKNIKKLNGKPLLAYSIETAIQSDVFDKIIVSTDDEKIAKTAKNYGAEVPFIRPAKLATDTAKSIEVLVHAIKWLEDKGENYDYVMKLQPTSPLRKKEDIVKAMDLLLKKDGNSVISVSECDHHPLWANTLEDDLKMNEFIRDEVKGKNRQELPKYYELNGVIFLSKVEVLLRTKDWYGKESYAYVMDSKRAIDIDNIIDFELAEIIMRKIDT